jgi:ATP/ADP translocase
MKKKNTDWLAIGLAVVVAALILSLFQASASDIVRNHSVGVFTLALVARLVGLVTGVFVFVKVYFAKLLKSRKGVVFTILFLLLFTHTVLAYAPALTSPTNPNCINTVRLHGILGDPCWLAD